MSGLKLGELACHLRDRLSTHMKETGMRPTTALAALLMTGLHPSASPAEQSVPPVLFIIFLGDENEAPAARINLWEEVVASLAPDLRGSVIGAADRTTIIRATNAAHAADPATAAVGIQTIFLPGDLADYDEYARRLIDEISAGLSDMSFPTETQSLVDAPLCRAMQQSLAPGEYVARTTVILPADDDAARACMETVARTVFRRAAGYDLDAAGNEVPFVDATADTAQAALFKLHAMDKTLIKSLEDRTRRDSNVYAPGEMINVKIELSNTARSKPGEPGALYRIGLDIDVRMKNGPSKVIKDARVYEGEVPLRIPADSLYFQNWLTAGLSLEEPGDYVLWFILTDLNAAPEKRYPLYVDFDVRVRE